MMSIIEAQNHNAPEEESFPIHGDLLEDIFALVPLVDLACASHVSKSWEGAISLSLLHINKVKPWLIIHTQNKRTLEHKTTQAYDPRTSTWVELSSLAQITTLSNTYLKHDYSILQSSSSNLIYEISLQGLTFSYDPLHVTWHDVPPTSPPRVWRVDPIVALIGTHIVVAGGGSWFEDDPLSVEMYDMEASEWSTCQSMPYILKNSATSMWLSIAANMDMMYVTEKTSGITYSFSPKSKAWSGPYDLRPDPDVFFSVIGFSGDDLILAGLIGHARNVTSLKLWKVKPEVMQFEQIGEIPLELLGKLKGEAYDLSSISLTSAKDFLYVYNSSSPAEIIFCEFVNGSWKWGSVENVMLTDDRKIGERMVLSCAQVGIQDLHMAMRQGNNRKDKTPCMID